MTRLKGKVALVTGASRGIGRAIAIRLAKDGALVAVHYAHNAEAAAETVSVIELGRGHAFPIQADLSSMDQVGQLFQILDAELTARAGSRRFDILVNNAGISEGGTIEETTESLFDRLFATNVKGPYFLTKQALPRLNDGGRIINITTAGARVAYPESSVYFMTKGAMQSLTLTLAQHLGKRGITVNTLAPGLTDTDLLKKFMTDGLEEFFSGQTALGRLGKPEDLADAAAFLASDDSRWVTAQYLEASGGLRL